MFVWQISNMEHILMIYSDVGTEDWKLQGGHVPRASGEVPYFYVCESAGML